MTRIITLTILLLMTNLSFGQDSYHSAIEQMLETDYDLQNGEWVFFDNEAQNLTIDYLYGATDIIPLTTSTEDFTEITNIYNAIDGDYYYDGGWGVSNQNTVQQDDNCLLIIYLRKVNELGKVSIFIQADNNTVFEENLNIHLHDEWTQYLIPFQSSMTYQPGELIAGLNLAWEVQEIEVAGMNILNFGTNHSLDELPVVIHNDRYEGYEADAAWRNPAADRIETFRKSDLTVTVNNVMGESIEGANVSIRMIEPDFKWGTQMILDRVAGNWNQNDTYQNRFLNLDGEGHRFEWIAPGNSFKWPGWEENWITTPEEKVIAAQWLKSNDFKVRFHTMVWPGWAPSPFDIEANADNPQYIIDRVTDWIDFINNHPGLQDVFDEYDIINELTYERDYEYSFAGYDNYTTGREFYIEVMNQFSQIVPDKPQVIADYVSISRQQTKGAEYDFFQNSLQEIVEGGGNLGGIGFQSHINFFPTSIYEVEEILTDFATKFDVPLKITEYDIVDPRIDDQVAAQYLEDFLTIVFSIPEVDMFVFWGLWDETHWQDNGTFFNDDWSEKPAAQAAFNKIFNEWWTEEMSNTNQNGLTTFRPFKGTYEILIEYEEETIIDTISVSEDLVAIYTIDQMVAISEIDNAQNLTIFPNPAKDMITIESEVGMQKVELLNINGTCLLVANKNGEKQTQLSISNLPNGMYYIKVFGDQKTRIAEFEVLK